MTKEIHAVSVIGNDALMKFRIFVKRARADNIHIRRSTYNPICVL